jgi:hypothetical protein
MHSMRELSGRPLLSTIAWIFVVRPPWLMPIAYFFSPPFPPLAAHIHFAVPDRP